jgi:hypothetical protein
MRYIYSKDKIHASKTKLSRARETSTINIYFIPPSARPQGKGRHGGPGLATSTASKLCDLAADTTLSWSDTEPTNPLNRTSPPFPNDPNRPRQPPIICRKLHMPKSQHFYFVTVGTSLFPSFSVSATTGRGSNSGGCILLTAWRGTCGLRI